MRHWGPTQPAERPRTAARWRVLASIAAALTAAVLASAAHAYIDAGPMTGFDTVWTPEAKQNDDIFTPVAGARYNKRTARPEDVPADSPTGFDTHLHAVSFRGEERGFAGGTEKVDGEERPVLYRYTEADGWKRDREFPGRGYIADIAWIGEGRALAVGGDGAYPKRESTNTNCKQDPSDPADTLGRPDQDPAGKARAWLYEDGSWRELKREQSPGDGGELSAQMRALSSVDFFQPPPDEATEFGIAGALCQIWHWSDGGFLRAEDGSGFEQPYSNESPASKLTDPARLVFRVRSVTFAKPKGGDEPLDPARRKIRAYAATAGCCLGISTTVGTPEVLEYTTDGPRGQWRVLDMLSGTGTQAAAERLRRQAANPDSYYSVTATQQVPQSFPSTPEFPPPGLIATPGGPELPAEPPSTVAEQGVGVSTARLLDGDGDLGGTAFRPIDRGVSIPLEPAIGSIDITHLGQQLGRKQSARAGGLTPNPPDGVPDWSVGVLLSSGQAVAYVTDPTQVTSQTQAVNHLSFAGCNTAPAPPPLNGEDGYLDPRCLAENTTPSLGKWADPRNPATSPEQAQRALESTRLFAPPTYALHAIDMIDEGEGGIGWAVGAHGAIVEISTDRTRQRRASSTEPSPPDLGKKQSDGSFPPGQLDDSSPWRSGQAGEQKSAGRVPSAESQPREQSADPRLHLVPGPTPSVVSRDGSEAWSIRDGRPHAFFDGQEWHVCDYSQPASSRPAQIPECESAAEVFATDLTLLSGPGSSPPIRVPLERDGDPSNDDEFELIGMTDSAQTPLVGFSGRRWRIEPDKVIGPIKGVAMDPGGSGEARIAQMAFVTPDDALLYTISGSSISRLFRFNGKSWTECTVECDPDRRITDSSTGLKQKSYVAGMTEAGGRIYAYGIRRNSSRDANFLRNDPFIVYRERGSGSFSGRLQPDEYDPAWANEPRTKAVGGRVESLAVTVNSDGEHQAVATGRFLDPAGNQETPAAGQAVPAASTLRLVNGRWTPDHQKDAFTDSRRPIDSTTGAAFSSKSSPPNPPVSITLDGKPSFAMSDPVSRQVYLWNPDRSYWQLVSTPRPPPGWTDDPTRPAGTPGQPVSDNHGGFYVRIGNQDYHFTDRPRKPVFTEAAMPARHPNPLPTSLSAAADGTVWAATNRGVLYRYTRELGWDRVSVPGWMPARSNVGIPMHALAVNEGGEGVAVGPEGRIAEISSAAARLDPAAGTSCDPTTPVPPCATTRTLRVAAIARDGSAIAAGDQRTVIWRPPGGQFRTIDAPPIPKDHGFADAAITDTDTAWLLSDRRTVAGSTQGQRQLWAGTRTGAGWSWKIESPDGQEFDKVAIGEDGQGFAIHTRDLSFKREAAVFERDPASGGEGSPWKKLGSTLDYGLTSVALPAGGEKGALIGGERGLVLTHTGEGFEVARPAEPALPHASPITSIALAPGERDGEVEAWALSPAFAFLSFDQGLLAGGGAGGRADPAAFSRLFHHATADSGPLADPARGTHPLPDAAPPRPDEVAIAAFGKSDCQGEIRCLEMLGSGEYASTVAERIVEEVVERRRTSPRMLSVFTGDISEAARYAGSQLVESAGAEAANDGLHGHRSSAAASAGGQRQFRRFGEFVADRLTDAGVPLFGAVGFRDTSDVGQCVEGPVEGPHPRNCRTLKQEARPGENLAWRQAMRMRSKPWGESAVPITHPEWRLTSPRTFPSQRLPDPKTPDPDGEEGLVPSAEVASGGAPTHYAIDIAPRRGGNKLLRLVFLDNSQGSLAASDPLQQPLEPDGGQLTWLDKVLCFKGAVASVTSRCTRDPDQRAVIVTNAPTYTYGPGALTETAADGAALEQAALRHSVDAMVSGRIGWNGLYWTRAPGVHEPCPGGPYPDGPPTGTVRACGRGPSSADHAKEAETLAATLGTDDATSQVVPADTIPEIDRPIPSIVASGAGGSFFPNQAPDQGETSDGYWHGYSVLRVDPSGDTRKTIVEQRPIYDWVGITAQAHILRAGQKMLLRGFARGPIGWARRGLDQTYALTRVDQIDSATVTHRFDLLEADPERPSLVRRNERGEHISLDPSVATVDPITGQIRGGRGNHPRRFAVAMLSVGDHVATYPLVFEPRKSFVPRPPAQAPQTQRVIVQSAAAATSNPPPAGALPQVASVSPPPLPSPPAPTPPAAGPPVPSPQAPPPPPPPPPPSVPTALAIGGAPPGLNVAPPASVVPPPAPPINPAPPGGARKEARQRQAATEKSGSDAGASETQSLGGDMADSPNAPHGAEMTRRDRVKAGPSFTAVSRGDQPSAWARGALYGGGMTVMALALAGAWTSRPRPRPRPPAVPAQARVEIRRPR